MNPSELLIFETEKERPMSTERRQILDMLAQGKISAEDAERLLAKLEAPPEAAPVKAASPKFLRVQVDSEDGDKVNIRVPLSLVRTGVKLTAMMPREAGDTLKEKGIDLSQIAGLQGDALTDALRDLSVDVQSEDGDKVRIYCE
jgi:hypothetical protein